MTADRIEKLRMELRRGVLVLAVLSSTRSPQYAYSLRQQLISAGIEIDEGTLYPLVRRLESQGLLSSYWQEGDGRRKRYYQLSEDGHQVLDQLKEEWQTTSTSLAKLLEEPK